MTGQFAREGGDLQVTLEVFPGIFEHVLVQVDDTGGKQRVPGFRFALKHRQ